MSSNYKCEKNLCFKCQCLLCRFTIFLNFGVTEIGSPLSNMFYLTGEDTLDTDLLLSILSIFTSKWSSASDPSLNGFLQENRQPGLDTITYFHFTPRSRSFKKINFLIRLPINSLTKIPIKSRSSIRSKITLYAKKTHIFCK